MPPGQSYERQPLLGQRALDATEVYPVIQMIRSDAMHFIDTPLTLEALMSPDLTYTLVRPLEEKYNALQRKRNLSVVFCFLLNRAYFLRDHNLTSAALSRTRGALCEILATRTLRAHATNMLELALALTTSWPVYSGADPGLIERAREERDDDLEDRVGNAIEVAIVGQAKLFIKSSACQKVIDGIWSGKIVYQADSSRSILSDTYKRNPIHFYDPHKAPLLDHYRLKVPAVRSVLEYSNFLVLFILFILALEYNELDKLNMAEVLFMIYALGFTLEKVAAMQEHGIKVYFKGTWNGFDLAFVTLFCTYAVLRLVGIYHHKHWARTTGIDFLALIAVLMFPRLAFVTLKNNLMVLALRAMIVQFVVLMLIAAFCFGGFLYALWTLSRNKAHYTAGQISWWMLDLFFGLDASGFDKATDFHPIFGPVLTIAYACLSNTLLVTVLVSILSHTFSTINDDAVAEAMFRRAVSTIEGVKADSLFSYQPPINLVALCVMLPSSYILTPRWFHKVNVFMIRLTSFPILLLIAGYERQAKRSGAMTFYETVSSAAEKVLDTLPRSLKRMSFFEGLAGTDADIDAIFEIEYHPDDDADDSALDMEDSAIPPIDIRARRLSTISRRRPSVSVSSTRTNHSHSRPATSPPASPRKPEALTPPHPPQPLPSSSANATPTQHTSPLPRTRALSLLTRTLELGQGAPSPLAQVFQPLPFPGPDAPEPTTVVSYGPATRRRLSSIHQTQSQAGGLKRHPTAPIRMVGGEGGAGLKRFPTVQGALAGHALSESPDNEMRGVSQSVSEADEDELVREEAEEGEREEQSAMRGPKETAGQIEEESAQGFSEVRLEQRLAQMEERQKRIEDLLVRLAANLPSR